MIFSSAILLKVLCLQKKRESKYFIAQSLKSVTLPSEALPKQPTEDQAPNKDLAAPPISSQCSQGCFGGAQASKAQVARTFLQPWRLSSLAQPSHVLCQHPSVPRFGRALLDFLSSSQTKERVHLLGQLLSKTEQVCPCLMNKPCSPTWKAFSFQGIVPARPGTACQQQHWPGAALCLSALPSGSTSWCRALT